MRAARFSKWLNINELAMKLDKIGVIGIIGRMTTISLHRNFVGGTYWTEDHEVGICSYAAHSIFDVLPEKFTLEVTKRYRNSPGWRKVRLVARADGVVAHWYNRIVGGCSSILTTNQEEQLIKMGMMEKGKDAILMVKVLDK